MTDRETSATEREGVGLCLDCVHARRLISARKSVFYKCGLAETDQRFRVYPPLPVSHCAGHQPDDSRAGE